MTIENSDNLIDTQYNINTIEANPNEERGKMYILIKELKFGNLPLSVKLLALFCLYLTVGACCAFVILSAITFLILANMTLAAIFAITSLTCCLLFLQKDLSPNSFSQAIGKFYEIIINNSVKFETNELAHQPKRRFLNEESNYGGIKNAIKTRFSLLIMGLFRSLKILFLGFPLILVLRRSIENIRNRNRKIVSKSEQEQLIEYFAPIRSDSVSSGTSSLDDYSLLRTLLNPFQLIQATLLWIEMVTITFSDSVLQLISPIPLDSLVRIVVHGTIGSLYVLLEPLKTLASIPACLIEDKVDGIIDEYFYGSDQLVKENKDNCLGGNVNDTYVDHNQNNVDNSRESLASQSLFSSVNKENKDDPNGYSNERNENSVSRLHEPNRFRNGM